MAMRMPPGNAIGYAEHFSPSHEDMIHVYDAVANVIETHIHTYRRPFAEG